MDSTSSRFHLIEPPAQRGIAPRVLAGLTGAAVTAAVLLAMLYFTSATGSAQSLAPAPAAAPPAEPSAASTPPEVATTIHAGIDFDRLPVEPDPSPRAIATYGD